MLHPWRSPIDERRVTEGEARVLLSGVRILPEMATRLRPAIHSEHLNMIRVHVTLLKETLCKRTVSLNGREFSS